MFLYVIASTLYVLKSYILFIQSTDEEVTTLRNDFERQAREIEQKYERKMRSLRDELDLRRKTEIHEIEERKNSQINTLMKNHEKAFSDIKNYYNDITLNNLALINTLKVGVTLNIVVFRSSNVFLAINSHFEYV